MKKTTYSGKSPSELQKSLSDQRNKLRDFRFGNASSRTKNVNAGKIARKEIARIMTELNKQK
jgi:ribosomal protein L29